MVSIQVVYKEKQVVRDKVLPSDILACLFCIVENNY